MARRFMGVFILLVAALISGVYLAGINSPKKPEVASVEPKQQIPSQVEAIPTTQKQSIVPKANAASLTETIGKEVAKVLNARNPQGPQTLGGIPHITGLNPEIIAEGLLAADFSKVVSENFNPTIDPLTLKIINAHTTEAFALYLKTLQNILTAQAQTIQKTVANPSPYALGTLVPIYDEMLAKILQIATPQELVKIQLEELRLLTIQRNIFAGMANFETDPTLAWAAIELLQPTADEFAALNTNIESFMKQHSVKL